MTPREMGSNQPKRQNTEHLASDLSRFHEIDTLLDALVKKPRNSQLDQQVQHACKAMLQNIQNAQGIEKRTQLEALQAYLNSLSGEKFKKAMVGLNV